MEPVTLARREMGEERIDLCYPCRVIWFDRDESPALAPRSVIELVRRIQAHGAAARNPLPTSVACPRCSRALVPTHDLCKSGRLSYFRCTQDGGRLTAFVQFLREKQFVRSLTPAELGQLRASVRQVRCSSCGAPVDIERSASCEYCGSPVAVLDADAMNDALQHWTAADAQARLRDSPAVTGVSEVPPAARTAPSFSIDTLRVFETGSDLLDVCIGALGELFSAG
jgi:DNA-directed RNA polymerase subunit RPC12/RpoP